MYSEYWYASNSWFCHLNNQITDRHWKRSEYHQNVGRQYYNGHINKNISFPTKYYEQQGQSPPFSFLACSSPHEKDLHINKLHIRKKLNTRQILAIKFAIADYYVKEYKSQTLYRNNSAIGNIDKQFKVAKA